MAARQATGRGVDLPVDGVNVAIANFFDRALLSAAQVIRGVEPDAIKARLESQLVEIVFDDSTASTREGQCALDMSVRLIARLYPALQLTPLGAPARKAAEPLLTLARSINPAIDTAAKRACTARLVLGSAAPAASPVPTIFIGSDAWLAKVSSVSPVGFGDSPIPFGAGAAACLGSANLFRGAFADLVRKAEPDQNATMSLLDFSTGPSAAQGPQSFDLDIGVTPLVGVGAIGNAAVWSLARTGGLNGTLHLVDHERVELSNLQRYVLTGQKDEGRQKVALASEAFETSGSALAVEPFAMRWSQYVSNRGFPVLERALVALDSARDRIAVQSSLPRTLLNAWTQVGDLGVSRHQFLGEKACLACLYLPTGKQPSEDQLIARALHLPEEPQEALHPIRELLVSEAPVGPDFVTNVASQLGIDPELLMPFVGEPLRSFYVKAVCGGIALPAGTGQALIEAPLAFQSALAGVMLAAELVADAGALRNADLPTKTVIDVMRPMGRRLSVNVAKPGPDSPVRCICQDEDFIRAYRQKHDLPAAPGKAKARKPRARG